MGYGWASRYYILDLLRTCCWGVYLRDGNTSDFFSVLGLEMEIPVLASY